MCFFRSGISLYKKWVMEGSFFVCFCFLTKRNYGLGDLSWDLLTGRRWIIFIYVSLLLICNLCWQCPGNSSRLFKNIYGHSLSWTEYEGGNWLSVEHHKYCWQEKMLVLNGTVLGCDKLKLKLYLANLRQNTQNW